MDIPQETASSAGTPARRKRLLVYLPVPGLLLVARLFNFQVVSDFYLVLIILGSAVSIAIEWNRKAQQ